MLILVSPVLRIPVELENTVTVVDFPLPDEAQMRALLQQDDRRQPGVRSR